MAGGPRDALHTRLGAIEDEIEQAREAIGMASGSATDPIVSDEIERLEDERDRLLAEMRTADETDTRNAR